MYDLRVIVAIFRHALLKIVQNLLLQCFNDAVITFIRLHQAVMKVITVSLKRCNKRF